MKTSSPPTYKYILRGKALLASTVIEKIKLSPSYLRIADGDVRFKVFAIITLEISKWA
jgi:hypothetical protein